MHSTRVIASVLVLLMAGCALTSNTIDCEAVSNVSATQQPIYRVAPQFPSKAIRDRIAGFVRISFTINEEGIPIDLKVQESKPYGIFENAAMHAVSKWRYCRPAPGKIEYEDPMETILTFEIAEEDPFRALP